MADFQDDDLNYGVRMDDPAPQAPQLGQYNPPEPVRDNVVSDEQKQQATESSGSSYDLKRAAHPVACIATLGFKAAAIFFYIVIGSIIDSSILTFIFVILLSSLDFWTVKNVTGRLLVGLRWWSEIDENGKETWRYENPDDSRNTNVVDSTFFWGSQLASTVAWALLMILQILTLSVFWGLLTFVCMSLSGTNLYAYYQCRGDHQKKLGDLKKRGMSMFIQNAL